MDSEEILSELHTATTKRYITTITYNNDSYTIAPIAVGYDIAKILILQAHVFYKGNTGKISPLIFASDARFELFDISEISYLDASLDQPIEFKHEISMRFNAAPMLFENIV